MSRKKINLTKNRVLLSDTLPFETPITFSNRKLYRFLNKFDVHISGEHILWIKDKSANIIMSLLNGSEINKINDANPSDLKSCKYKLQQYVLIKKNDECKVPFSYPISHPTNNFRTISIPHPTSQLLVVDFYENFKDLIIYYCNLSNFSVRYPTSVASCEYHKNYGVTIEKTTDSIEIFKMRYESLKSYFTYKDYSNIYKVYDSPRYLRCEKKYTKLLKLDISRCFESIYTHSLPWAIYTKKFVKDNLKNLKSSFSDKFDRLMMKINHDETNGIIIGPEFSRIFAEIILQRIDHSVENNLYSKHKIKHKVHYEILRYVDDYFVFINDEQQKEIIIQEFSNILCEFKLFLNKTKIEVHDKPIITSNTIAKRKISKLISSFFELRGNNDIQLNFKNYQSKNIILDYKSILKSNEINYYEVSNYSLVICENNLFGQIETYFSNGIDFSSNDFKNNFINYLYQRIDFILFLYSINPTINASVRIGRIISFLNKTLKDNNFSHQETEHLKQLIFDNCISIMKEKSGEINNYIEISYILLIIKSLGRMYRLSEDDVATFFGIIKKDGAFKISDNINYFAIISILQYTSNIKRYINLTKALCNFVKLKFSHCDDKKFLSNADNFFLLFDMIASPLFNNKEKDDMLKKFVHDKNTRKILIENPILSFSEWKNFDLLNELVAKKSVEVY